MSAVALADVLCTISFGVALLFVLLLPVDPARPYVRPIKAFLVVAMSLYVFVGVSNILEWGGVTAALDVYEDYAEVLFIPLMAYLVFSLATAQQFEALQRSQNLARREQELLTSVVEASPAGIMVVTPDGQVTFANDIARDALGLRSAEGSSCFEAPRDVLFGPEPGSVSGVSEGLRSLVSLGEIDDVVRYAEHPGGRIIALDVGIRPLRAGEGGGGSVVAFVDTTERLRYRQDLEKAVDARTREMLEVNRKLEVTNEAKRDFLARMSHELRTPLNSILGFTTMLLKGAAGDVSAEQHRQLEMIRSSGASLLSLVDDVVDIALIETGRTTAVLAAVDACEVAFSVAEMMRPMAADRQIDLDTECPDGPVELRTDPDKLAQIVRNLVGNAIKFTEPGGWVRVVARSDGDAVTISVADSGRGIAGDDIAKVFGAFQQVRDGSGTKPQGTGLGLSICRDLAELLGGSISVESVVGTGSTFTLTLPVAGSAETAQ
jgi:PAS domain S-box-containing protein